jgi:hypothetical protein
MMKLKLIPTVLPLILLTFFSLRTNATDVESVQFKDFKTDLCTSWPEGTRDRPMLWAHCCIKHDMAYWVAGDKNDLKLADLALKSCVTEVAGTFQGTLMYRGIRAGHYFPIKSKYRWGWAWPKNRKRYSPLSLPERDYVLSVIYQQTDVNPVLLDEFIDFRFKYD